MQPTTLRFSRLLTNRHKYFAVTAHLIFLFWLIYLGLSKK